jgi:hypothetical protein
MWKTLLITVILLMIATPAFALTQDEMDFINAELGKIAEKPIEAPTDKKGWNVYDTTLLVLRVIDWGQTRDIADSYTPGCVVYDGRIEYNYPDGYEHSETNPILGKHPSLNEVDTYFSIVIGIDLFIVCLSHKNPEYWAEFKKYWQIIGITLETYCVTHNWQLGIGFKF